MQEVDRFHDSPRTGSTDQRVAENMNMPGDKGASSVSTDLPWILLIFGAVIVLVGSSNYLLKKSKNLPPGPRNWPLVGAILQMTSAAMHVNFDKLAERYGPVVYFRLGLNKVVLVSSAEIAEELLKARDAEFCDRGSDSLTRTTGKYLGFESTAFVYSNYTPLFKLLRRVSISEFFTAAKIKTYEDLRSRETAVMIEKIWTELESSNSECATPVPIAQTTGDAVQNILFKLCLGMRFDDLSPTDNLRNFPPLAQEVMDLLMKFNLADFLPFLERLDPQGLIKVFKNCGENQNKLYEGILREKKQARKLHKRDTAADEGYVGNFVDVLLDVQDEDPKMNDNAVMAALMTMLVAGIDTSSTAIEWTLLELIRNPDCMQRLQAEIDTVVGKERQIQESDLKAMTFLNAVIMECFRLHPVVSYSPPHCNKAPSSLGGYHIPAKTSVLLNIYSIGHDPNVWKDPLRFNPDRFILSPGEENFSGIRMNGTDFRLLPFSSGRRMCTGYSLALVLVARMVATLVHAFDWSPPPGVVVCGKEDENASLILHVGCRLSLCPQPRLPRDLYA